MLRGRRFLRPAGRAALGSSCAPVITAFLGNVGNGFGISLILCGFLTLARRYARADGLGNVGGKGVRNFCQAGECSKGDLLSASVIQMKIERNSCSCAGSISCSRKEALFPELFLLRCPCPRTVVLFHAWQAGMRTPRPRRA
jgi:hypothetical protein